MDHTVWRSKFFLKTLISLALFGFLFGNWGLFDHVCGLEWVKENIECYGGDSNNVTIFGESAGSWSIDALLCSPKASGQVWQESTINLGLIRSILIGHDMIANRLCDIKILKSFFHLLTSLLFM